MNTVSIPANATAKAIIETNKPPKGATHFRYTEGRRKPIIDSIKNINCIAGCTGKLEFGTVKFEGRGRYAKIKEFNPIAIPTPQVPEVVEPEKPVNAGAKPGAGRKKKIMGFSACAVAKALGKAGVKWEEADRIFRSHGIEMPKASLSVQLGFGRREESWQRHGMPADLSADQIECLRRATTV